MSSDATGQETNPKAATEETKPGDEKRHKKSEIDGVRELLGDADYLLDYAAKSGIELDREMVRTIIAASTQDELTDEETIDVMTAVSRLVKALQPVTADALRNFEKNAVYTVRWYFALAAILVVLLLFLSTLSFMATSFSKSLDENIARANDGAVTLTANLGLHSLGEEIDTPLDIPGSSNAKGVAVNPASNAAIHPNASPLEKCIAANPLPGPIDRTDLTDLQKFVAASREVYGLSQHLQWLLPFASVQDIGGLEIKNPGNVPCEAKDKIVKYQTVRSYAKDIQHQVESNYGALNINILPVIYAVLGAFASLLISASVQLRQRILVSSPAADFARVTIAAIVGEVIGLFSGLVTMGSETSLPLLGLAFLVGYRTDIFFSALDGFQTVARTKP